MRRFAHCFAVVVLGLLAAVAEAAQTPIEAYSIPAGTIGTQNYGGSLGMDFDVQRTIQITHLGCFDSGSDGINGTIFVQVWTRGYVQVGPTIAISGVTDPLTGGQRYQPLGVPLTLPPGDYTIVAYGYHDFELNGNAGTGSPVGTNNGSDNPTGAAEPTSSTEGATFSFDTANLRAVITYVGGGRFGNAGQYPFNRDGGPANRYMAGSFKYIVAPENVTVNWGDGGPAQNLTPAENPATASHVFVDEGTGIFDVSVTENPVPTYSQRVLANSPRAYYRLDDAAGPIVLDSSGNGNNATPTSPGGGFSQPGAITGDTSVLFNGVNTMVMVPDQPALNIPGALTVECWMFKTGEASDWVRLVGKGGDFNGGPDIRNFGVWEWPGPEGYILFQCYDQFGNGIINFGSASQTAMNTWYHIVCTADPNTGLASIYLNGNLDAQVGYGGSLGTIDKPMTIGYGGIHTYFIGRLDEVAVYNTALTGADVADHFSNAGNSANYAAAVLADSPVVHCRLNEATGPTAADSSGNGRNGTYIFNELHRQTPGSPASAQGLTFSGGYVTLPDVFGFPNNPNFSFEVWFKTATGGVILGNAGGDSIVDSGTVGGWVPALYVGRNGQLRSELFWHNGLAQNVSAPVDDGNWHHAVITYSGEIERMYVDGQNVSATTVGQFNYNGSYFYWLGLGYTGGWPDLNAGWSRFDGSLDEVAVYDYALPAEVIREHFTLGAAEHLIVSVTNVAPAVTITGGPPGDVNSHATVTYNSNVVDPGTADVISYLWTVTRDSAPFPVVNNTGPSFTFDVGGGGSYVISLAVNDGDGASDSDSVSLNVIGMSVTITGTPAGSVDEGSAIVLGATSFDPNGFTVVFSWEVTLGGNPVASGSGASFSFTPVDEGTFTVALSGDNGQGETDTDFAIIDVINVNPAPSINVPPVSVEGSAVVLTSNVTDPGTTDTFTYSWTVTQGPLVITSGTDTTISFTPVDNGNFDVALQVNDNDGGSTTVNTTVAVNNAAPAPIAGIDANVLPGASVTLNGTFTDAGLLDTHTFQWSVSASDSSVVPGGTGQSFTFTAGLNPVMYTITFTVTDNNGGVGSDNVIIAVPGYLDLVVDTQLGDPFSYTFDILGIPQFTLTPVDLPPGITSLADIGLSFDGLKTITGTTTHAGAVTVGYVGVGMTGNLIINIKSHSGGDTPRIISAATASPNPAFVGKDVTFTVVATDANHDILSYYWDFGDGTFARGNTVIHVYQSNGKFDASVTVSDGARFASGRITMNVLSASENTYTVDKAQIKFDFRNPVKSKMNVSGKLPLSAGLVLANATVHVEIPGSLYTQDFILNSKFVGGDTQSRFSLAVKVVGSSSSNAKFTLDLINGPSIVPAETLFGKLSPLGFVNKTIGRPGQPIDVPLLIVVSTDDPQISTMHMNIIAVKNKNLTAKLVKQ